MRLTPLEAHATCLALVFIDLIARTWRLQWLVRGIGNRITFGESFRINCYAEAGASLTPMRVGGEPARVGGMLAAGVPATASFVAIAYEAIVAWPVLIIISAWILLRLAPQWWAVAGPHLASSLREGWHWALAVTVASILAWVAARRIVRGLPRHVTRPLRRILVYWRRMPWWPLVASIPLSAINVVTRIALLPVLALTLPDAPPLPVLIVGSFALTYSQLILPTPSGVGVVDLGFVGGAAGNLGDAGGLLLAWRIYSNGIGTALGLVLAFRHVGLPAIQATVSRLLRPSSP